MAELEIGAAVGLEIDTADDDDGQKKLNGLTRPHRDVDRDPATGGRYRKDTATPHPVALTTSDKGIAQNNPTRSGLYIDNNSGESVLILFGGTDGGVGCTPTNYTFRLGSASQYEMPMARDEQGTQRALWTGPIRACTVAGVATIMVTDITELTN
jgi:hypothetical protein